ncbi:hypothetical protein JYU34_012481 [Plutella xylostella]|uniref:Ig-like domain-containing protein n=1 Tax=Plutella xylostella TaxID=51655 RepID=A0ABQ7QBF6_PLUXY|nr:hypothetical protein JYU34_012481 [Plutella xylostella]
MSLVLVLGLFVVIASAHNITLLEVPQYGDPRKEARLVCHYESARGDPPLHSVKWYRENNEIFRFTPGQVPSTRTFNTTSGSVTPGACNMQSCAVRVALPPRYNTRVAYTCEVSAEGPRFAVVKQTKNLTVAVALHQDPVIQGAPGSAQPGEQLQLNCSTAPAAPPASLLWYIDGQPEKTESWLYHTEVSPPNEFGLRASWRTLRFRVPSANARSQVSLRCEATQPTRPPYSRASDATVVIDRSPHLSMFTASGSSEPTYNGLARLLAAVGGFHVLYRHSAFSDLGTKWF